MNLEPEFLEVQEKHLVALSRDYTMQTRKDIPDLWNDFWTREWEFNGNEEPAAYGVSYAVLPDGSFSYAAGRNIDPLPDPLPEGACVVTLSAGRYVVFRGQGAVTEIPQLFDAIFSEWLPGSGEKQREGAVFERYPYDDNASPASMIYEIWVPIAG